MNMLHNEYLRQEIQGNIDYVFNDLRAYLLKNVELPLYDPDKCLGDVDDIKHYLVHDILNIISYVYAYSSDEEKYDIVERCQMVFDLCKFYINFDLVSVIEYNSIINGVTQDNFEKKARVLVNELKIVNVLAEWKMMDGDVSQFYAYELLRGLSYYIVVGASNRKPIEECTKKDKALFIIFDKLFRRYCRLRHTFNSKCVGSLLETSYVFMKYYEGLFAFSGASLPMISGITEGNTYIDRCIFKYTKEFGDIKEFADFLYEYKLIDDPEKYRFDTEEEEETTEFVADEADFFDVFDIETDDEFDVFDIETDDEFDDFDIDANIEFDDFSLETEEEPVVTKSMKRYIEADEIPQYEHYDSINDDEVFIDKIKRRIV